LLTGSDPTPLPEAPLAVGAYRALSAQPDGLQLLIARGLSQPKTRFRTMAELTPLLGSSKLPNADSRGFRGLALPQPARTRRPDMVPTQPRQPQPQAEETSLQKAPVQPWWRGCLPWLAVWAVVLAGVATALTSVLFV
jgi:hypothetical protein